MEATPGNSIFDFETLFSDFQEWLNGSGLSRLNLNFWGKYSVEPAKKEKRKKKEGKEKKNKWKKIVLTVYKLGWTGSIRFVRSVKNKQYQLHSICLVQKLWLIRLNSKIVYYDWKRVDPAHVDCCRNNVDMGRIIWTLQKQQCRVEPAAPAALN